MKKGSALLVVLGMLAFMVISATAFSIYMRQHRLPSSFLRERISSSFLVKGALAEAMSELDSALGDDLAPNDYSTEAGYAISNPHQGSHNGMMVRNYWRNRIYMRENATAGVNENETSSTTFLEGLAYLPPPLVNTFRYWSRRSPTAMWSYLPYDTGRYVFTAIDVSDYLDVNRQNANAMRDSSSTNRITLAYRFEDSTHGSSGAAKAAAFDSWIKARGQSTYGPLVSMADYNMALRAGGPFVSAFCDYIENAAQLRPFYGGNRDTARQQTFITDSWHPHFVTNNNEIALSDFVDDEFCPFGGDLFSLTKAGDTKTPFGRLQRRLTLVELAALQDYLDEDNVPISLAIPTIERTPQLTGIQVQPRSPVKIMFKHRRTEENQDKLKITHHAWSFEGIEGSFRIDLTGVFPFKRSSGLDPADCSAEVLVKGFLTDSPDSFSSFRTDADLRPTAAEWSGATKHKFASDGVFTARGSASFAPANAKPLKPADTLINQHLAVDIEVTKEEDGPRVFAFRIEEKKDKDGNVIAKSEPKDDEDYMGLRPFAYLNGAGTATPVPAKSVSNVGKELSLVVLAWVRLVDGNGKTVDLAPATLQDDADLNGIEVKLPGSFRINLCGTDDQTGNNPVFSMPSGGNPFGTLSLDTFGETGDDVTFAGDQGSLALFCNDPRYNFAPEDWYETEVAEAGIKQEDWLSNVSGPNGDDIFQFVSNAGYLQSIGELQFLPKISAFGGANGIDPIHGDYYDSGKYNGVRRNKGNLANNRYMWKTHWAFNRNGQVRDLDADGRDIYEWDIVDTRGGVSMTPYTSSLDLFMAGLANTPYDWIVADPLNEYKASDIDTYSFNSRNDEARIAWEDLEEIAEQMQRNFRSGQRYGEWNDWGSSDFFGVLGPDDGIHDVDRKFLFSYWKSCYDTNQQLFLIFVRAEPTMMMGSGSNDHTPAQLGGRAVALVWREPKSSITASSEAEQSAQSARPHRMRVLFYHQFE